MQILIDHWDMFVSVLVPILTLCGTIGWAAGSYILRTNAKVLSELSIAIAELREQNKTICETYQKDIRTFVTKDNCREDSLDCNKKRDAFRTTLEKKIDEMLAVITMQDVKRHDHNNKNQSYFLEICERLAAVETALGIQNSFPSNRGRRMGDVT